MEFGRLKNIDFVHFALPPDHPGTARVLTAADRTAYLQPQVYVGCPTWNNKPWLGNYYPAGVAANEHLFWYSRQFNTIELNTTHYRIPDAATINRWRDTVPPNFTFCPKVPQLISHDRQLLKSQGATIAFQESLKDLNEHLGCAFLQLPPTFGLYGLPVLEDYIADWAGGISLAIELREAGWFNNEPAFKELGAALEACNLATVITDVAGRRDVLHMRLTNSTAFIRFVGYGLHPSDYLRLNYWVERLKVWFDLGLQKLYFFIHQENISHSPILINYFLDQLEQHCGIKLDKPKPIPQPVQGSLF